MKRKKIALIELNNFHEHVLVPQLGFYKDKNIDVYLFLNCKLKEKHVIDHSLVKKVYYINTYNPYIKIVDIIIKAIIFRFLNFEKVLFNTYSTIYTKLFYFIGGKCKDDTAIIHNVEEYIDSKYKFKNIFLLSSTVYKHTQSKLSNQNMEYFYPLFRDIKANYIPKIVNSKIEVCIPGNVEYSRRDYKGLVDLISKSDINNVKFIILGNCNSIDGPDFCDYIREKGMEEYFEIFNGFIPYDSFVSKLSNCDLIMPLIHPSVKNFNFYHETKMSSSFIMSYTYFKPLLLFSSLASLDEFNNISIEYDLETFTDVINSLNINKIKQIENELKNDSKTSLEDQCVRYLNLLNI